MEQRTKTSWRRSTLSHGKCWNSRRTSRKSGSRSRRTQSSNCAPPRPFSTRTYFGSALCSAVWLVDLLHSLPSDVPSPPRLRKTFILEPRNRPPHLPSRGSTTRSLSLIAPRIIRRVIVRCRWLCPASQLLMAVPSVPSVDALDLSAVHTLPGRVTAQTQNLCGLFKSGGFYSRVVRQVVRRSGMTPTW